MRMKKFVEIVSVFSLVMKVAGLVLGIITIYLLAWKVFGHSPVFELVITFAVSILTMLVCGVVALLFKLIYKIGGMEKNIKYMKRMLYSLIKEFREFKNHTH